MKPTTDPAGALSAIDTVIREAELASILTDPAFLEWEYGQIDGRAAYAREAADGLICTRYWPGSARSGRGVETPRAMIELMLPNPIGGYGMTISQADYARGLDVSRPVPLYTEGAPMWLECTVPECPVDEDDDDAHWVAIQAYTFCRDHAEELPTSVRDPDRERRDREAAHEPLITRAEVHQVRSAS